MHQKLTRTVRVVSGVLAALVFASGVAVAANAHFLGNRTNAAGPDENGNLLVNFKIAGLGDTVTTTVTATADATAVYGCLNNGGQFPQADNKQASSGEVEASDDFTSGKNGQIEDSLTLMPPPPPPTLHCGNGQEEVLVSVCYTNVQVSEPNAGTESISGTFCRTFFD